MGKKNVAGLHINSVSKNELLLELTKRILRGEKTFITTPYSEFLFHTLQDPSLLDLLNTADIAVPDGIGIFLASKYLSIPLTLKTKAGKAIQAFWQMVYTGLSVLLYPKFVNSTFKEKIPGSELIWDLAKFASEQNLSLYLLGGVGDIPQLTAQTLQKKVFGLQIAGYSSKNANDPSIMIDIQKANPDILMVAFGPLKQEKWIINAKDKLSCKVLIGLGGTFDYIAGKKIQPPKFIRSIGLEWLWRLFTQPARAKRIFNAVPGLIYLLIQYKIS